MSFTIQIVCECGGLMRYDAEHFRHTGVMEWVCWDCEQMVMSSDLRQCLIDRRVGSGEQ
jgi:hypothetical protein